MTAGIVRLGRSRGRDARAPGTPVSPWRASDGHAGGTPAHPRRARAPTVRLGRSRGRDARALTARRRRSRGRDARLTGLDFLASPCVPSPVSAIRTPKLPLLPLWEKGAGGMRGKGAREWRTSLISPKNSTLERLGDEGDIETIAGRTCAAAIERTFRSRSEGPAHTGPPLHTPHQNSEKTIRGALLRPCSTSLNASFT